MADLESLNYESISEMSPDEALEMLRQIRLGRRVPVKSKKAIKSHKPKPAPDVSSDVATELLKILGAGK